MLSVRKQALRPMFYIILSLWKSILFMYLKISIVEKYLNTWY